MCKSSAGLIVLIGIIVIWWIDWIDWHAISLVRNRWFLLTCDRIRLSSAARVVVGRSIDHQENQKEKSKSRWNGDESDVKSN